MSGKRYYWLKLQDGFFNSKRIKKLRKLAGGDTYTIIYLKMQLLAMKTDGYLKWTGLESDFASELALDLDEDSDNVKVTLAYLQNCGLIETSDDVYFFLPYAVENTGSESASAERVRQFRERQALQCNAEVTQVKRLCNGEKEIEKEIETDSERELEKPARAKSFIPPTVEEVAAYCRERENFIDAQHFIDYYEARNWMLGKTKMKDWKAAIRTWEQRNKKPGATISRHATKEDEEDLKRIMDKYGWGKESHE